MVAVFDIETTSMTTPAGMPIAFMYHWQFYVANQVILGRTWDEFDALLEDLEQQLKGATLPVYVHNLAFEFSHLCHRYYWDKVFCTRSRNPIRARFGQYHIELRDSLVLSGMGLDKLPTQTKKLVGDIDYSLIRHAGTPMTDKEIQYCINDIIVLAEYITGKLGNDNMATIPMTRTGYVRRDVRQTMEAAKEMPHHMTMDRETYEKLKTAYAGGFTHAAHLASGHVFHHVRSLDITSSYPTVLVAELYPMGVFRPFTPRDQAHLEQVLKTFAAVMTVSFYGLRAKDTAWEHIISESKCTALTGQTVDNGRLVSADFAKLELTEIDFYDILNFYDADNIVVSDILIAPKARLPKSLVERVIHYYEQKTTLKGKHGLLPDGSDAETMYAKYKEFVNAIYGCMVTSPVKPEISFNGDWTLQEPDVDEALDKLNRSRGRWNFYAWGIWCTAYARHNLYTMMSLCGPDYLYSDTDSLKILNYDDHKAQFDWYNDTIQARLKQACLDLGIDPARINPYQEKIDDAGNVTSKYYPLGVFTDEGEYETFKTLGAKRYLYTQDGELHATVAGAPKKSFKAYMDQQPDPFEAFQTGLVLGPDVSGKNLHQYQAEDWTGPVTDYRGNTMDVTTYKDACHISATTVSLNMSEEYALYLASLGTIEDIIEDIPV